MKSQSPYPQVMPKSGGELLQQQQMPPYDQNLSAMREEAQGQSDQVQGDVNKESDGNESGESSLPVEG